MIGKLLVALAAPFVMSAAPEPQVILTDMPQVKQVLCDDWRGSAFRTGTQAYTTAWHVASGTGCTIDGEPIEVTYHDAAHDVAFLHTNVTGEPLKADCGGFVDGAPYAGVGYANGLPVQRVIFVTASSELTKMAPWGSFETLYGDRFIPGQSGGPVIGRGGVVVGVVNGYHSEVPLSFSQALKDTPLCR